MMYTCEAVHMYTYNICTHVNLYAKYVYMWILNFAIHIGQTCKYVCSNLVFVFTQQTYVYT